MLKIDAILDNVPEILRKLDAVSEKKWPSVLARAANETGYYVVNKVRDKMKGTFDRPVPFTLNGLYLKPAKATSLEAVVQWRDYSKQAGVTAEKYLKAEQSGGARAPKRFERALAHAGLMPQGWVAVPTAAAPKDNYGNVQGGYITQILSSLQANPDGLQNRRVEKYKRQSTASFLKGFAKTALNKQAAQRREDRAKAKATKFFVVKRQGERGPLKPGIYERISQVTTAKSTGLTTCVFLFQPQARYKAIFPFQQIARDAANAKFAEKLDESIAKALAKK